MSLGNCSAFSSSAPVLPPVLVASASGGGESCASGGERKTNEVVTFLRAQLAEAINLQDKDLMARLHETIRCLALFENHE